MKRYHARQAVVNLNRSEHSFWSIPCPSEGRQNLPYEHTQGSMGGQRAFQNRVDLQLKPKFQIDSRAGVFTSGSCFAREIEVALERIGVNVLSWSPRLGPIGHFFQRYNTFSILQDFKGAFDSQYDERLARQLANGKWCDYSFYGPTDTKEETIAMRHKVFAVHREIQRAAVLIVTLGLVEVWHDLLTGMDLNIAPSELLAGNLSRYELRVTNYQENYAALKKLIAFVSERAPGIKVIVTVSPVPFSATFSGEDVITANMFSKATLRAVAQAAADDSPDVDYFPSYEMVMSSKPELAWWPDRRHVHPAMIEHVVTAFQRAYMPSSNHK